MPRIKSTSWMVVVGVILFGGSLVNGYLEIKKDMAVPTAVQDEVLVEDYQAFLVPVEPSETPFQPAAGDLTATAVAVTEVPTMDGTAAPTAEPTFTPTPSHYVPDRIVIPSISLDASIVEATTRLVRIDNQIYQQWKAPDEFAVGWHPTSATLGNVGNTVLNGHHNVYGKVFGSLIDVEVGDEIILYSGEMEFTYTITNKMILPELGQPLEVRLENARWLQPSDDERITLVTCWPPDGNLNRLIVVAVPKK